MPVVLNSRNTERRSQYTHTHMHTCTRERTPPHTRKRARMQMHTHARTDRQAYVHTQNPPTHAHTHCCFICYCCRYCFDVGVIFFPFFVGVDLFSEWLQFLFHENSVSFCFYKLSNTLSLKSWPGHFTDRVHSIKYSANSRVTGDDKESQIKKFNVYKYSNGDLSSLNPHNLPIRLLIIPCRLVARICC